MNLRNAWNYVRLYRVVLTIPILLVCLIVATYALIAPVWWLALAATLVLVGSILSVAWPYMQWLHEANGTREMSLNQFAKAEVHFRKALLCANQLDAADPCRGRVLALLTEVASKQGNYDDAEAFGRDWRDAEERAWGSDHPRTAAALEELAEVYDRIARHHQARPLLEQALVVRKAHQTADPLAYVHCLDAIGSLWCRLERYAQAEPHFREAHAIAKQRLDPASPDSIVVASGLSTVCVHLDKIDEADALAQWALALAMRHPEPASMPVAYCLSQLASVRRFQDRYDEAEELLRRSMGIVKQSAPNNAMALHGDLHLLGVIHRYQSRWAEAEECFSEVLRLRQEYCAPEDLSIARVLEDYAELLELMGRMEEAQTHQNHAKQIRDFHSPFRLV